MARFDETKHKRGKGGRFARKNRAAPTAASDGMRYYLPATGEVVSSDELTARYAQKFAQYQDAHGATDAGRVDANEPVTPTRTRPSFREQVAQLPALRKAALAAAVASGGWAVGQGAVQLATGNTAGLPGTVGSLGFALGLVGLITGQYRR